MCLNNNRTTLSVGQTLKDADFTMDITMNSGIAANVSFKEANRKVDANESITTPAGTWNAYVISYEANMKTKWQELACRLLLM